ncbi:polysaccharide pyruvyl transferase family protein [Algoriphagus sp. PAP.12]|uniref:polysaccharide pyruvyl transferase family protein n=1 Tax=Algoriphagus sp. PAP.12 TaxID=2996678 RepID=UPI00227B923C|nr:polysaccharide pyruvyl transferase family protein [Algoriphagus sp. PAP.12]
MMNLKKNIYEIKKKALPVNIIQSFKFNMSNYSPLIYYWDYKQNWGDSINKFLFESVLKKEVFVSSQVFNLKNQENITGVGSILSSRLEHYSIWGSGFLSENHSLIHRPNKVLSVRGKLTAKKIKDLFKIDCPILGDPGLLFKEYYNPDLSKKYSVGIIPHFKELDLPILKNIEGKYGNEVLVISPTLDIFKFAEMVKQCEKILSSSLHGLILAESYGIPTERIILSDRLIGGDFKFMDYYSGVGLEDCFDSRKIILDSGNIFSVAQKASQKDLKYNAGFLINCLVNHVG